MDGINNNDNKNLQPMILYNELDPEAMYLKLKEIYEVIDALCKSTYHKETAKGTKDNEQK